MESLKQRFCKPCKSKRLNIANSKINIQDGIRLLPGLQGLEVCYSQLIYTLNNLNSEYRLPRLIDLLAPRLRERRIKNNAPIMIVSSLISPLLFYGMVIDNPILVPSNSICCLISYNFMESQNTSSSPGHECIIISSHTQ